MIQILFLVAYFSAHMTTHWAQVSMPSCQAICGHAEVHFYAFMDFTETICVFFFSLDFFQWLMYWCLLAASNCKKKTYSLIICEHLIFDFMINWLFSTHDSLLMLLKLLKAAREVGSEEMKKTREEENLSCGCVRVHISEGFCVVSGWVH